MSKEQPKDSFIVKILDKNDEISKIQKENSFSFIDYIFPLHTLIPTNEKIKELSFEDNSLDYYSNYRYYYKKRYEMVHCFNRKYDRFLSDEERKKVKEAESLYSKSYLVHYLFAFYFLLKRPLKSNILNLYFFCYLSFLGKVTGYYLTKSLLDDVKNTINIKNKKKFKIKTDDLYDDTVIPNWRCYLYYYGFL